jgi:hypothetical protein
MFRLREAGKLERPSARLAGIGRHETTEMQRSGSEMKDGAEREQLLRLLSSLVGGLQSMQRGRRRRVAVLHSSLLRLLYAPDTLYD